MTLLHPPSSQLLTRCAAVAQNTDHTAFAKLQGNNNAPSAVIAGTNVYGAKGGDRAQGSVNSVCRG